MKKAIFALFLMCVSTYAGDKHWMYFRSCGTIWIDGELREYVMSRGLMEGGRRYIVNGHTVWQVQLTSGQWADVYP